MRIQMQVWNDTLKIHEVKYVNVDEVKPTKKAKRFRGDNKISNFKDKQRVKRIERKGLTPYQYSCIETHRGRQGMNPYLILVNNWS